MTTGMELAIARPLVHTAAYAQSTSTGIHESPKNQAYGTLTGKATTSRYKPQRSCSYGSNQNRYGKPPEASWGNKLRFPTPGTIETDYKHGR